MIIFLKCCAWIHRIIWWNLPFAWKHCDNFDIVCNSSLNLRNTNELNSIVLCLATIFEWHRIIIDLIHGHLDDRQPEKRIRWMGERKPMEIKRVPHSIANQNYRSIGSMSMLVDWEEAFQQINVAIQRWFFEPKFDGCAIRREKEEDGTFGAAPPVDNWLWSLGFNGRFRSFGVRRNKGSTKSTCSTSSSHSNRQQQLHTTKFRCE